MRIGSGGIMLPHYSPLKIAEVFSQLAGLYPGRIDLGLGRAPGSDQRTAIALQRDRRQRAPNDFPSQLAELIGYLEDSLPGDHPFAAYARTLPGLPHAPEPWVLGSSADSAAFAGDLGLPYCFADFINARPGRHRRRRIAHRFVARHAGDTPHVAVAVWTIVADTDAEAAAAGGAGADDVRASADRAARLPVPDVETALAWLADRPELDRMRAGRRVVAGSPETVRAGLRRRRPNMAPMKCCWSTSSTTIEARKRSYTLAMQAMTGLARSGLTLKRRDVRSSVVHHNGNAVTRRDQAETHSRHRFGRWPFRPVAAAATGVGGA